MKVSFEGIGEMVATFEAEGTVKPGDMVKLGTGGKVSACDADDEFAGLAVTVREGFAGVQFAGLAQVNYSGTDLTCGWKKLAADGSGGVKAAEEGGREYLTVAVDTAAKTAVVRL